VLKDFVPHLTDWKKEIEEGTAAADLYKRTWARCRNFILPMNPQRTELEFAVRKILSEYGVHVKQSRKKVRMRLPPEE
jgi:poly(A) polymerase